MIAWLSDLGPLGGGAGGPDDENGKPYFSLVYDDCEHVLDNVRSPEPTKSLYEGAASACLAAFHNRPDLWVRAEIALTALQSQTSNLDCPDMRVYQFLQSIVVAHRQDPDARFVKSKTENGENCPHLYDLDPKSGPPRGGYEVRLVGVNLPPRVGIHFGDRYLVIMTSSSTEAFIIVPPTDETSLPMIVDVQVDGWPFRATNPLFMYKEARTR